MIENWQITRVYLGQYRFSNIKSQANIDVKADNEQDAWKKLESELKWMGINYKRIE